MKVRKMRVEWFKTNRSCQRRRKVRTRTVDQSIDKPLSPPPMALQCRGSLSSRQRAKHKSKRKVQLIWNAAISRPGTRSRKAFTCIRTSSSSSQKTNRLVISTLSCSLSSTIRKTSNIPATSWSCLALRRNVKSLWKLTVAASSQPSMSSYSTQIKSKRVISSSW